MYIRQNIRYLRKKARLNQTELGAHIGKAKTVVSAYELGNRTPDLKAVVNLSKKFGISVDDLLFKDLSETENTVNDDPMKLSVYQYARALENKDLDSRQVLYEIGEKNMKKVLQILLLRIEELENDRKDEAKSS